MISKDKLSDLKELGRSAPATSSYRNQKKDDFSETGSEDTQQTKFQGKQSEGQIVLDTPGAILSHQQAVFRPSSANPSVLP